MLFAASTTISEACETPVQATLFAHNKLPSLSCFVKKRLVRRPLGVVKVAAFPLIKPKLAVSTKLPAVNTLPLASVVIAFPWS